MLIVYCVVLINHEGYISTFVGNTLWLVAVGYYVYITFLGYSCQLHILLSSCIQADTKKFVFLSDVRFQIDSSEST